jgi:hypothetical protein
VIVAFLRKFKGSKLQVKPQQKKLFLYCFCRFEYQNIRPLNNADHLQVCKSYSQMINFIFGLNFGIGSNKTKCTYCCGLQPGWGYMRLTLLVATHLGYKPKISTRLNREWYSDSFVFET